MPRIALLAVTLTAPMFAVAMLSVPTAALAETAQERAACMGDAFTHCSAEIPSSDRVYACLVKKRNVISTACRKVIVSSISSTRS